MVKEQAPYGGTFHASAAADPTPETPDEELTPKQTKAALKFHIAQIDLEIANLQHQKQQAKLQLSQLK